MITKINKYMSVKVVSVKEVIEVISVSLTTFLFNPRIYRYYFYTDCKYEIQ